MWDRYGANLAPRQELHLAPDLENAFNTHKARYKNNLNLKNLFLTLYRKSISLSIAYTRERPERGPQGPEVPPA